MFEPTDGERLGTKYEQLEDSLKWEVADSQKNKAEIATLREQLEKANTKRMQHEEAHLRLADQYNEASRQLAAATTRANDAEAERNEARCVAEMIFYETTDSARDFAKTLYDKRKEAADEEWVLQDAWKCEAARADREAE